MINGDTTDLYHSDNGDIRPTVTITAPQIIDKIVVYNRVNCCQHRIMKANIKVYKVSDLINVTIIIIIIIIIIITIDMTNLIIK